MIDYFLLPRFFFGFSSNLSRKYGYRRRNVSRCSAKCKTIHDLTRRIIITDALERVYYDRGVKYM